MIEEVRDHLECAEDSLKDADWLMAGQRYGAAVARAYYVMFHAATAALLYRGIERRSHHGIISAFGEFLVKPGHIDSKYHAYIREGFDLRSSADYEPTAEVPFEQAESMISRAREFVEICKSLCEL